MRRFLRILLPLGLVSPIMTFGCGAGSNAASQSSQNGNNPVSNVQTITVNAGPDSKSMLISMSPLA